jgi:hypothetical protein
MCIWVPPHQRLPMALLSPHLGHHQSHDLIHQLSASRPLYMASVRHWHLVELIQTRKLKYADYTTPRLFAFTDDQAKSWACSKGKPPYQN